MKISWYCSQRAPPCHHSVAVRCSLLLHKCVPTLPSTHLSLYHPSYCSRPLKLQCTADRLISGHNLKPCNLCTTLSLPVRLPVPCVCLAPPALASSLARAVSGEATQQTKTRVTHKKVDSNGISRGAKRRHSKQASFWQPLGEKPVDTLSTC